jgi:outer membrane protein assembly factor BamA
LERILQPRTGLLKKVFLCFFLACLCAGQAQIFNDSIQRTKRRIIAGVPVLFYTPETRFGFGLSGFCIFNWKKDSLLARRSSVTLGFAYTQNRQVLFYLPYNLLIGNRNYQLYGEVAYNRYNYNFYGVGNKIPQDYVERYGVEFPRLRITMLKRVSRFFYAGPRYAYDRFTLFDLREGGYLAGGSVNGSGGGSISGMGAVLLYDSRDYIFYPSKGILTELVVFGAGKKVGSSFNYARVAFDFSTYRAFSKSDIVAVNLYSIYSPGDLPFFQMGMLGGIKKMRGFYEGRYRDNNAVVLQCEYRRHLFWIIGATVFGSAGQVARRYHLFHHANWKYTYGAGLRLMIDKHQRVNLRADFAVGHGKVLPYFTVAEAF